MKKHLCIALDGGAEFSFLEANPGELCSHASIVIRVESDKSSSMVQVCTMQADKLLLVHRAIGELIDSIQPGVIYPRPEGDPCEADAMKLIDMADDEWRKINA